MFPSLKIFLIQYNIKLGFFLYLIFIADYINYNMLFMMQLLLIGVNITLIILHKKDSSKPKLKAISGEFI